MVDVHLSSSYIVGFDVFDHQLDRGVAVVGVLLHRVTDVERLHTLDMVVVPVHAESDGVHGGALVSVDQFQLEMLQFLTHELTGAVVLYAKRTEYGLLVVRPERTHLL